METLENKIIEAFEGKVVRKDLAFEVKGGLPVPTYVLEYLLGQYCASNDEQIIREGVENLGLQTVIDRKIESGLVVSVKYPDSPNWDFKKVHDYCYERGFTIYPGKISTTNTFRLCALGAINVNDIKDFFVVLKEALQHYNIIV